MANALPFSPEFLQKYELGNILGEGAFGIVFQARNRYLQRDVAIKALKALREDDAVRFGRESTILSSLDHPNVLRVIDAGIDNEVVPYLITELMVGQTLQDLIKQHRPPLRRSLEILASVGDALAYAHGRGIIHRDVKPANVFVTSDGQVKLADFGLARVIEGGNTITKTGVLMGTPHYISPESAMGERAGPASDQYALGVMAYEMAAGRLPFEGPNAMVVIAARLTSVPPPPSTHAPGLAPALDEVVMKALGQYPADRYASVVEFTAALRNLAAAIPASGGRTSQRVPVPKRSGSVTRPAEDTMAATREMPEAPVSAGHTVADSAGESPAPVVRPGRVSGVRKPLAPPSRGAVPVASGGVSNIARFAIALSLGAVLLFGLRASGVVSNPGPTSSPAEVLSYQPATSDVSPGMSPPSLSAQSSPAALSSREPAALAISAPSATAPPLPSPGKPTNQSTGPQTGSSPSRGAASLPLVDYTPAQHEAFRK